MAVSGPNLTLIGLDAGADVAKFNLTASKQQHYLGRLPDDRVDDSIASIMFVKVASSGEVAQLQLAEYPYLFKRVRVPVGRQSVDPRRSAYRM